MKKTVIGIAGWSGSGKSSAGNFLEKLGAKKIDCFVLLQNLFQPGEEGYRQIVNYFGEEFLLKSGKINQRKLWKFVYSDLHKLKILDFLLQPLLIDRCQKLIDSSECQIIVIEQIAFVDQNWNKIIDQKIWLERESMSFIEGKMTEFYLPLLNVLEIQKRLYTKPSDGYVWLTNNSSISQLENQLEALFNVMIRKSN
jgi:dephospho-CoA kinase